MAKEPIKESNLAKHFVEFFSEAHDVYKEVPAGGIIDIIAVSGPIVIGIEVKTSLNFKVIEQAVNAKKYCHFAYVAVSRSRLSFAEFVCREYGIGILMWDKFHGVKEMVKPKMNRKPIKIKLYDYMKQSEAGSQNNRVTAFKNTINQIVSHLNRNNGKDTIDNTLSSIDYHWRSPTSAKSCLYQWISSGVITEFGRDGKYLFINNK